MAFTNYNRAILGPLTTTFTPPPPCTIAVGLCSTCDVAWWGQTCAPKTVQDDPNCWPTTTAAAPEPSQMLYGWGFYSPGLVCPAGYTSACTAIAGQTSGWKVQYLMQPAETFVGCCPTGFHCDNYRGQTCVLRTTSITLPTVTCQGGSSNHFGFTTVPNSAIKILNLYAPMIQLAWKSTDLTDSTATTTSAPTSSPASYSTPHAPPTGTETGESQNQTEDSSGITTGAIAGIAVGTALGMLLLLGAAFLLWRHRRRSRHAGMSVPSGPSSAPPSLDDGGNAVTGIAGAGRGSGAGTGMGLGMGTTAWAELDSQTDAKLLKPYGPPRPIFEAPAHGHDRAEMPGAGITSVELPTERYC